MKKRLDQVATADLTEAKTVQQMAEAEGHWSADSYTVALSERIRHTCEPLDRQRERLACLAQLGGLAGDQAAADELARQVNDFVATAQAQPVNATISYENGEYVMTPASEIRTPSHSLPCRRFFRKAQDSAMVAIGMKELSSKALVADVYCSPI